MDAELFKIKYVSSRYNSQQLMLMKIFVIQLNVTLVNWLGTTPSINAISTIALKVCGFQTVAKQITKIENVADAINYATKLLMNTYRAHRSQTH